MNRLTLACSTLVLALLASPVVGLEPEPPEELRFPLPSALRFDETGSGDADEVEERSTGETGFRSAWVPAAHLIFRVGPLDIDGNLGVNPRGFIRNDNTANALGLEEETVFQPRIDLDWLRFHLVLQGLFAEYDGTGTTTTTIDFGNGNTISANTPVATDIELGLGTGNLYFDILGFDHFEIGVGFGLGFLDYEVEFQSLAAPVRLTSDDTLGFGYLGARGAFKYDRLRVIALVHGVSVEFEDDDLSYFEYDVFASYSLFRTRFVEASVLGGYRFLRLEYDFDSRGANVDLDVDFSGPYGGLMISF